MGEEGTQSQSDWGGEGNDGRSALIYPISRSCHGPLSSPASQEKTLGFRLENLHLAGNLGEGHLGAHVGFGGDGIAGLAIP